MARWTCKAGFSVQNHLTEYSLLCLRLVQSFQSQDHDCSIDLCSIAEPLDLMIFTTWTVVGTFESVETKPQGNQNLIQFDLCLHPPSSSRMGLQRVRLVDVSMFIHRGSDAAESCLFVFQEFLRQSSCRSHGNVHKWLPIIQTETIHRRYRRMIILHERYRKPFGARIATKISLVCTFSLKT